MPISPEFVTQLAGQVLAYAGSAEVRIVQAVTGRLKPGLDRGTDDSWRAQKLAGLQELQNELLRIAAGLTTDLRASAEQSVSEAAFEGRLAAAGELLGKLRQLEPRLPGLASMIELAMATLNPVTDGTVGAGILRAASDAYRAAVAEATSGVTLGAQTRRQAAQRVLDRWARRGVAAFVDTRGRTWDLASYAEMATRSASQRAMVAAHTATLQRNGVDLVIVSNAPQECARCRPYEGKVLSLSGQTGTVVAENPITGRSVRVDVKDSLQGAQSHGFMHPNCRHSVSAYLPGVTAPHRGPTADPEGDVARQRQRELERRVRAAKRMEAVALGPLEEQTARARVRAAQAGLRAHLETPEASGLRRLPQRERLGVAR